MTELRRAGKLEYSRKYIDVNVSMIREALRLDAMDSQPASPAIAADTVPVPKPATLRAGAV
jgi:hypothetical protein